MLATVPPEAAPFMRATCSMGPLPCNGLIYVPGNDPCGVYNAVGGTIGPNKRLMNGDSDNFAPRIGVAWDVKGDGDSVMRFGFGQFFQRERVSPYLTFLNNTGSGVEFAGEHAHVVQAIEARIRRADRARELGFSKNYMRNQLSHISTEIQVIDENKATVKITGERLRSINPVFALVGKLFFLIESHEVDETLTLVKEDDQWKVCGRPFSLSEI